MLMSSDERKIKKQLREEEIRRASSEDEVEDEMKHVAPFLRRVPV
jgi:hypothetical protein